MNPLPPTPDAERQPTVPTPERGNEHAGVWERERHARAPTQSVGAGNEQGQQWVVEGIALDHPDRRHTGDALPKCVACVLLGGFDRFGSVRLPKRLPVLQPLESGRGGWVG